MISAIRRWRRRRRIPASTVAELLVTAELRHMAELAEVEWRVGQLEDVVRAYMGIPLAQWAQEAEPGPASGRDRHGLRAVRPGKRGAAPCGQARA